MATAAQPPTVTVTDATHRRHSPTMPAVERHPRSSAIQPNAIQNQTLSKAEGETQVGQHQRKSDSAVRQAILFRRVHLR